MAGSAEAFLKQFVEVPSKATMLLPPPRLGSRRDSSADYVPEEESGAGPSVPPRGSS